MHNLIPDQWYLMFVCGDCKTRQVLFPDLSNGTSKINASYSVNCTKCGHYGTYDSDTVERYQYCEEAKRAVA